MILERYTKQPVEVKDYDIDYTDWLAPVADTLSTATTTVECLTDAADTSLVCNAAFVSPTSVKCWMAGGTAGQKYKLTVNATTTGGRVDQSELLFTIKNY